MSASGPISLRAFRLGLLPVCGAALLASVGSLQATTYTWDPAGNKTSGSDGPGIWNAATPDFTNGSAVTTYNSASDSTVLFGSGGSVGTGSVLVPGSLTGGTLNMLTVTGTAVNGYVPGYTFKPSGTAAGLGINLTNLELSTAPTSAGVQTLTTINVPLTTNTISFTQPATLSLGDGSTQFGLDAPGGPAPNISGSTVANGAASTLLLNGPTSGSATTSQTYVLGTAIAIGSPAAGTGGVQVNAGATLTTSTATTGARNNLDVGYSNPGGNSSAGVLIVNGGTVTTGTSGDTVNIVNNSGPLVASALSGRLIVNSGVFNPGGQIIVGNTLLGSGVQSAELDVNGGTVLLANGAASAGSILLNSGSSGAGSATLNLTGGNTTLGAASGITLNPGSTAGTSTLALSGGSLFVGSAGITDPGGANTAASVTLSGGTVGAVGDWKSAVPLTLATGTGGNVTFQTSDAGAALPAGATVTSATAHTIELDGVLSGTGGLNVSGGGTLLLTNANTYAGPTCVSAGTLRVNGSITSPTAALSVGSGATLGGTGMLTLASASVAGTLAPGAAAGATSGSLTLHTTNGMPLSGTLLLGAAGNGVSAVLNLNGTLTLNGAALALSGTLDGKSDYEVAGYGALSGTFATVTGVPSGYTLNYDGHTFASADIELDAATPVPEPAAWVGALLGLGLVARSHRRRRVARRVDAAARPVRNVISASGRPASGTCTRQNPRPRGTARTARRTAPRPRSVRRLR